ncbi:MAG: hypothetical protein DMF65_09635 [Acidobacteria bacterium]|nr:MAG: hypothetical protein DMF65_09635 [Acidobacteriota bacterium]
MNCQEFESNLEGLARGAPSDSRARAEASAHEEACQRCAARLADERALTSALRALASSMKEAQTPARVEAALVAEFRARSASVAVVMDESGAVKDESGAVAAPNVVTLPERAGVRSWSWAKTLAVASLAAAAALALYMLIPPFLSAPSKKANAVAGTQPERKQQDNTTHDARTNTTSASDDKQLASSTDDTSAHDDTSPQPSPSVRDEDMTPRVTPARRSTTPVRAATASFGTNGGGVVSPPGREVAAEAAGDREIATDFIPLVQGGRFGQADGGHLVRVELPRSALVSFGLPVNFERAGGRVKADVLLGDDGIARAIRFVR